MRKGTLLVLALSLMAALLVGCNSSTVKIGWVESSGLTHRSTRYSSFDGLAWVTFRAETDQAIVFNFGSPSTREHWCSKSLLLVAKSSGRRRSVKTPPALSS